MVKSGAKPRAFVLSSSIHPPDHILASSMRIPLILAFAGAAMAQGLQTGVPLNLTLEEVLKRARMYSQQVYTADYAARLAHEDTIQAKAGFFPTISATSAYIYTQPNGTLSGVFVPNDGPHIYYDQANVHGEILNLQRRSDYRRTIAAEALARAKSDLAMRGLTVTVVQDYYGLVVAQRRIANAQQSVAETQRMADITQKMETGGEAAHADVVKAQIQLEQRQRDLQDAQLNTEKARLTLAVLIFPTFGQEFTVEDDLTKTPALPALTDVRAMAARNNPDLRAAQSTVEQQTQSVASARAAYLPTLTFDYFYGIEANEFAVTNPYGQNLLGSVAQATLTIPIWNWGITKSKVKQAQMQLELAKNDLSLAQRNLLAEEQSFYLEAQSAALQMASLKRSLDLSAESLRLTLERYEAGEAIILDVVDAQSTVAAARNAYDDGLSRYRLALANLQTLTGAF